MAGTSPVSLNAGDAEVPTCVVNGPEAVEARYTVYDVAFTDAVQDTAIDVDDLVVAVTEAGAAGGGGGAVRVVADAGGDESAEDPPGFVAATS